jgi:hypothetical protein
VTVDDLDRWVNLEGPEPQGVRELLDAAQGAAELTPERQARLDSRLFGAIAEERRRRQRRRTMIWVGAGTATALALAAGIALVLRFAEPEPNANKPTLNDRARDGKTPMAEPPPPDAGPVRRAPRR